MNQSHAKNDVANAWNDRSSVNLPHATNHSVSKWRSINRIPVCSAVKASLRQLLKAQRGKARDERDAAIAAIYTLRLAAFMGLI